MLGETEQDKYGNNLNELLERFGLQLENDTVQDYEHYVERPDAGCSRSWQTGARGRGGDLLARVNEACFYRATTISSQQRRAWCSRARTRRPRSRARR